MTRRSGFSEPRYWDLLDEHSKERYLELRDNFSKPCHRNQRHHAGDRFKEALDEVAAFVHESGSDTPARALVAGYYRLENGFAINVQQFVHLYPKCKSAVNFSLQQLNYVTCQQKNPITLDFLSRFPDLRSNFGFTRQWTIRQIGEADKKPVPPLPPLQSFNEMLTTKVSSEKFFLDDRREPGSEGESNSYVTPPELSGVDQFSYKGWDLEANDDFNFGFF